MAEELIIDGNVEHNVIVLTVRYRLELLLQEDSDKQFRDKLVQEYHKLLANNTLVNASCIVNIQSQDAGGPLIRGLFELWKEVTRKDGRVICANFPPEHITSLTTLGLIGLKDFSTTRTKEDAIKKVHM